MVIAAMMLLHWKVVLCRELVQGGNRAKSTGKAEYKEPETVERECDIFI